MLLFVSRTDSVNKCFCTIAYVVLTLITLWVFVMVLLTILNIRALPLVLNTTGCKQTNVCL